MRRFLRLLACVVLVLLCLALWVAWQMEPDMVRRGIYPAKARLVAASTQCDGAAPEWLHDLAVRLAVHHDSPANQVAFVSAGGGLAACANGWHGLPFISPRVGHDTPMRLASLSKIVAFMALLGPDDVVAREAWLSSRLVQVLGMPGSWADPRIEQISIRHLLNHSAGFDRHKSGDPMAELDHRPWCPHALERIGTMTLDYAPGTRHTYSNVGYCLAEVAYGQQFGEAPWVRLEAGWRMADYGLDFLERRDSPVRYNFMNQSRLLGETDIGPDFVQRLDWKAARAAMGMTGNARGLARFIHDHREQLQFALAMRDDEASCNEARVDSCFDGFLNRFVVDGKRLWRQRGYLYGMSASFLLDESGNYLVWLGAGEGRPLDAAHQLIEQTLLRANEMGNQGGHAHASRSDGT